MAKYEVINGEGLIPNTEIKIKDGAFKNRIDLTHVIIPNTIEEIGEDAFFGCTGLTKIVIPVSVKRVRWGAFAYCTNLATMIVAKGNPYLDSRDNCNAIIEKEHKILVAGCKNTIIPNSVLEIRGEAFKGCSDLMEIIIPESVKTIGWGAFRDCTGLTKIFIPKNVSKIEGELFNKCTNLTSIVISEDNKDYDSRNNCNAVVDTYYNTLISGCKTTTIPDSVKTIKYKALADCKGLTSVEVPTSVIDIWPRAFENCCDLADVVLSNSLEEIGYKAFSNCIKLSSIEIPFSVRKVDNYAFDNCTGLKIVVVNNPKTIIGTNAFPDNSYEKI